MWKIFKAPKPLDAEFPAMYEFAEGELEWVEDSAIANLKMRRETADMLAKESQTTLTVLLAAAGGAWAYAAKLLDGPPSQITIAALVAAIFFTLLCMGLVWFCMRIQAIPAVFNEPKNLLQRHEKSEEYEEWRFGELKGLQRRITTASVRNNSVASRLNVIRVLAVLTPVLAVGTAALIEVPTLRPKLGSGEVVAACHLVGRACGDLRPVDQAP